TNATKYCIIELPINKNVNSKVKFKIDTGASVNIISVVYLRNCEIDLSKIVRNSDSLVTYTGHKIPIVGKIYIDVKFENKLHRNLEFYVVEGKNDSILGLQSSIKLGMVKIHDQVEMKSINVITENVQHDYAQLIKKYDIFNGIGKLNKPYHIEIKENVTPKVNPIRNVPFALQQDFCKYLDDLQKLKIIEKVKGKQLVMTDTLSRLNETKEFNDQLNLEEQVCLIEKNVKVSDTKIEQLATSTNNDKNLKIIKNYINNGWPKSLNKVPSQLKPYYKLRSEITLGSKGLIYMGQRIIIPTEWQNKILSDIHVGHLGIQKCILKARNCVYWPNINQHIENLVNRCSMCNKYANSNTKEPLKSHQIIKSPWKKLGIDLYELYSETYLIVVDYYSKYPEICSLNHDLTAKNVINKLKSIFARHGIPYLVVSDSGSQFISKEFQTFANEWNFKSIIASPHHQQSNGLAERTIQSLKKMIKKCSDNKEDIYLALLSFRNTPVVNTYSPSQILMSRHLRDHLPIYDKKLNPAIISKNKYHELLNRSQIVSKHNYDKKVKYRNELPNNALIWYQKTPNDIWRKGKIVDKVRDRTYKILTENGKYLIRNKYYIKESKCKEFQVSNYNSSFVATHVFNKSKCLDNEEPENINTNSCSDQNCNTDTNVEQCRFRKTFEKITF
ncbi:hypothetical protein PPYR_14806, partial [Photinus pyralis]